MVVVRIEHRENGMGIFTQAELISESFNKAQWYCRHGKMVGAFFINGFIYGKHFCAYNSIEEMGNWLKASEIKLFIMKGFVVLELEVTDYIVDTDQTLFTKESIVGSKDITELFA